MAKELTPGQMLGELMVVCNALTASGVDVPADNKRGADLVLSAATTQGTKTCDSCNGRGIIEATAHNNRRGCAPPAPRWLPGTQAPLLKHS